MNGGPPAFWPKGGNGIPLPMGGATPGTPAGGPNPGGGKPRHVSPSDPTI